jgi:hypothetical protein
MKEVILASMIDTVHQEKMSYLSRLSKILRALTVFRDLKI